MAVKIRLVRFGGKKKPFYRIVVADSRYPRNGRFLEVVGTYDSKKNPALVTLDKEKVLAWLKKGAEPTNTVLSLLKREGLPKEPKAA